MVRVSGVTIDITERKEAAERQDLLAREVDRVSGADVQLDSKRLGTRLQDGDRLWVTVLEDEEPHFPLA